MIASVQSSRFSAFLGKFVLDIVYQISYYSVVPVGLIFVVFFFQICEPLFSTVPPPPIPKHFRGMLNIILSKPLISVEFVF